jgi:hypothetical protein
MCYDDYRESAMIVFNSLDMPKDFSSRVHSALRSWHVQNCTDGLDALLLAHKIRAECSGATPRLISNQVLLNGIEFLKQADKQLADLLCWRFIDLEKAFKVAHRLNISEDMVYQWQRKAIFQLAGLIWAQENELHREQVQRIEAHLEPSTYTRLFGVTQKITEIHAVLTSDNEPWMVALEGMGGIGKTSLADALARQFAGQSFFDEIGWISARRRLFHLSGEVEPLENQPDLTFTQLVDHLIDQFRLPGLVHLSDTEKQLGLKDFLKSRPCLVIVDNLETAADYRSLALQLSGWINPSKFLITTRTSLRDLSGVYVIPLQQLVWEDAQALIRYEAETRGLGELAKLPTEALAPVYQITGGNPLAIKLFIGQIHSLSLPAALNRFRAAKGKSIEELLAFLFDSTWKALDSHCRRVMQAMLLVADEGGQLEQIMAAAELAEDEAASDLHRLATLSLVNVMGNLYERRYSIHPLTRAFIARQS